ncbi:hypothetical protein CGCF413_v014185 [Colletotrichum fructicola]|nr:hypothetical protein CGCF413_v014185 [Colletotrichum fructicola]
MAGVTSDNINKIQRGDTTSTLQAAWGPIVSANQPPFASSKPNSPRSLIDPLAQDLDHRSRRYLNYFASNVSAHTVTGDHRQFSFAHVKRLSTVIKFFKHLNNEGLDSEQHKLSGLPID